MPLVRNILGAIRSAWSNRSKAAKRSRRHMLNGVDQLDHRQLLTASFTGNVINDFPIASGPGVKFLTGGATIQPNIPPALSSLISVTGFNQEGIALSYDPVSDQLAVGIIQPDNGKTGQIVIAGDADNNLNSATVDPAVLAIIPTFSDIADLGGTEEMGVFMDLNNDGTPDIIAGIAGQPTSTKNFQVATAIPAPNPISPPQFGTPLPGYEGNFYLVNNPAHPAMEFTIKNFSTLYQQVIGTPLTPNQVMTAGAVGRAAADSGISEGVYFAQPFNWQDVNPATDLSITKTDVPDPVTVGNSLVYSIFVKNTGTFADNFVTVTDAIPAGVNVLSITPSQGTVTTTPTGFTANMGAIAAGGSAAITIVVQPTTPGIITNKATVTGSIRDTDPTNNSSSVNTTVIEAMACPPILVNPHHSGVINTLHRTLIRVNVFGTADFNVNDIISSSVKLSGATPVGEFTQKINGDPYLDRTYLFAGNDPAFATLPAGFTTVTLTGNTTSHGAFASQANVYNVNQGEYTPEVARKYENAVGTAAKTARLNNPKLRLINVLYPEAAAAATKVNHAAGAQSSVQLGSSTVRIPGVAGQKHVVTQVQQPTVQLGSSSVRIPISNGFGSPVVIQNASRTGSATKAGVRLNPTKTVKVQSNLNAAGSRVRANIANSINDFAMSS